MGLSERRHVLRQNVRLSEIGQRQLLGVFRRSAAGDQLTKSILEMLRQFFDDLGLAGR